MILASPLSSGGSSSSAHSSAIAKLDKDFTRDQENHIKFGPVVVFNKAQSSLLKAMSACYYGKTQLTAIQKDIDCLTETCKVKEALELEKTTLISSLEVKA